MRFARTFDLAFFSLVTLLLLAQFANAQNRQRYRQCGHAR